MTQPQPPVGYQPDYASQQPSTGMALASMILGICAIPLSFFCIGFIPGIIALILGIVANSRINKNPLHYAGKGFALTGIITGLISSLGLLLIFVPALLLPSLGRAREMANRSTCAANMKGIVVTCMSYSVAEADAFPTVGTPYVAGGYVADFGVVSSPVSRATDAIREAHKTASGNAVAGVWMLAIRSEVGPKTFLCKSDPFGSGSPSPVQASGSGSSVVYYLSPEKPSQFSYSIAYPWNGTGKSASLNYWWKNTTDSSVPVIADMAPLEGTGTPARTTSPGATPTSQKAWNSFNHGGQGQNVGFGDGHTEWMSTPVTADVKDNIWTLGEVAKGGVFGIGGTPAAPGRVPVSSSGWSTAAPYDTIMVPLRDGSTGAVR